MRIAVYFYYAADPIQRSVMEALAGVHGTSLPFVAEAVIDLLFGTHPYGVLTKNAFRENFAIDVVTITPEEGDPFSVWSGANAWCGHVQAALDAGCIGFFPYTLQALCFPCPKNPPCIYEDW